MQKKSVLVVGAGLGGLSLAVLLARQGMEVAVLEKNGTPGGRARTWSAKGFTFDMGPSWYMMPEVFETFFQRAGTTRAAAYDLQRLDPSYRVFFSPDEQVDLTTDLARNQALFDGFEPHGGRKLAGYLDDSRYKYEVAMREFVDREYTSITQFFNRRLLLEGLQLNVLGSLDSHVRTFFTDRRSRQVVEYHMVFLGSSPHNAPGLYAIMSHVDLTQGIFYPAGGMGAVTRALVRLAENAGVKLLYGHEVTGIESGAGRARRVQVDGTGSFDADVVAVNADYVHAETKLLAPEARTYPERWWKRKVMAPSFFLVYLGLSKKLQRSLHHTLYLAPDWDAHFRTIFDRPSWPEKPCFYLSVPSRTDPTVAPAGGDTAVILVPIASGLEDTDDVRQRYRDATIRHVEEVTGEKLSDSIVVERVYSPRDFTADYNSWQGSGLGLAHTLMQTAVFRPRHRSARLSNLYYTGAYTHPGIGVPMTLISSGLVSEVIRGDLGAAGGIGGSGARAGA